MAARKASDAKKTYDAAMRGSAKAQSAVSRMKRNDYRSNMAKPAPYGRFEDGSPRGNAKSMSANARINATRKRASDKRASVSAKRAAGGTGTRPKKK